MFYYIFNINYFIFQLSIFFIKIHHEHTFLFSVVMSIYNKGQYLDESIGSLLNQTVNFEKNIQLILVNDGSTDNSEEICLKYQNIYPENIIYIYKENGGLSSARNVGLNYVNGRFLNFLDPDDLWSNNSFKYILKFFRLYPQIDLVSGRMQYFEQINDLHALDYKFYKSRVIDLRKEYNCIHISVASSFFRSNAIYGKKFIEGLISGEDTRFVHDLLLYKPFMGVLQKALYYYRKRSNENLIVQTAKTKDAFYFITPNLVHNYLFDLSLALYNKPMPFIQYYIAYDILFRMVSSTYKYISLPKLIKYGQIIISLLRRIKDKYILEQRNVQNNIKIYALSKKYDEDQRKYIKFDKGKLKYHSFLMIEPEKNRQILILKFIDIKDNFLNIEGRDNCWLQRERYYYYCKIGKNIFFPSYRDFKHLDLKTMFGTAIKGRILNFNIPIINTYINESIKFYFSYMNNSREIYPSFGYYSHIPPINNSYYANGDFILTYNGIRLTLINNSEKLKEDLEKNYCEELEKIGKNGLISYREIAIKHSRNGKKKEIWLINDRSNKAGDNGEYFFRYLNTKNPYDVRYYFVITNNCSDYYRLKDLGNILILGSKKYNQTFLKADKLISSTSNAWVDNPFGDDRKYLIDLFHFDFIFLQHGITKDDVSNFLNRFTKNYSLIITASKNEYQSFLSYDYDYSPHNIKLTGFSRYDNFQLSDQRNGEEKTILLIPTWRQNIIGTVSHITYESIYSDNFINTEFFEFYDNLMNSQRLLEAMKSYNYTGIFCLHPSFIAQSRDFHNNSLFKIMNVFDYQKILIESSLLITDYSSVFFDFAFLNKPVIYTQFDYEEYRNNHYRKGYFDYILDGFGPVCLEIESCVDSIIDEIKSKCKIKKKYLKRIRKFFAFFDRFNNDRIYQAIRNLSLYEKIDKFQKLKDVVIIIIIICIFFLKKIFVYKCYFFK